LSDVVWDAARTLSWFILVVVAVLSEVFDTLLAFCLGDIGSVTVIMFVDIFNVVEDRLLFYYFILLLLYCQETI